MYLGSIIEVGVCGVEHGAIQWEGATRTSIVRFIYTAVSYFCIISPPEDVGSSACVQNFTKPWKIEVMHQI